MKYCIHCNQSKELLEQADEIIVDEKSHSIILDYIEFFPQKTIILQVDDKEIPLQDLQMYRDKLDNLILSFKNIVLMDFYIDLGFNCFWMFPIETFNDLRSVIEHKPCYINLGAPLIFNLDKVKNITKGISLRTTANLACADYLPRKSGVCGNWIRPEDTSLYEPYIDTLEFYGDVIEEKITFETYKKGKWSGNLNLLIKNLNYNIDNRLISQDLIESRMNCGQRCMSDGDCHLCDSAFIFADEIRKLHDSKINEASN